MKSERPTETDGDLVIDLENYRRRFAIVVILQNNMSLGYKECQCIADCMEYASRGSSMSNKRFYSLATRLKMKFGTVHGPYLEQGRLALIVSSGVGTVKKGNGYVIKHVSLYFDYDDDLVVEAHTISGTKYTISLVINGNFFFVNDCRAFIDILNTLEASDTLDPNGFLCALKKLHSKYHILNFGFENGFGKAEIYATDVENDMTLHSAILNAVENTPYDPTSDDTCPYPGISYIRELHKSGQAQLYESINEDNVKLAVKVFELEQSEIYRNELKMLLRMPEHKNVIDVIDFYESPKPCIIMRWIDGAGDLWQYLRRQLKPIPDDEARNLCIGIAEGLAHLHRSGIVHRDLKPANILLHKDDNTEHLTPILIDLGIGSAIKKSNSSDRRMQIDTIIRTFVRMDETQRTSAVKGTLLWISPEMILREEWSEKSDIYAFGLILWQMLSGKLPYLGEQFISPIDLLHKVGSGLRPKLSDISHADESLKDIVTQCWDEDPKKRPTAMQILDRLRGNDAKDMFKSVDKDGNCQLSCIEFMIFLERYAKIIDPYVAISVFKSIDDDNSKTIEFEEFERFWNFVQQKDLQTALSIYAKSKLGREQVNETNEDNQ